MAIRTAAILLSLATAAAAGDGTIVTAKNAALPAKNLTLSVDSGDLVVRYADAAGAAQSVKASDVVEITFHTAPGATGRSPAADDVEIILTTGDVMSGAAGARSGEGIQLATRAYGDILVKFEHVRAIVFPANRTFLPKRPPGKIDVDVVFKKSSDRAEGTLLAISKEGVEYKSLRLDTKVKLPLADTAGIWLSELQPPPREPATLFSTVLTSDGSSLRGQVESLDGGVLTFKDLYGQTRKVAADHLSGLYMKNGRVVFLSDLEPSDAQEDANYIRGTQKLPSDLEYPFQRDRNARGTRLVTGGVEHRKGLGVRAHSALSYKLEGAFTRFQATFGLDAVSMGLGAVAAEVWVDGRKAREMSAKGNEPPQGVDIDVSGARELRLVVTWAGHGQSDFADWASARLIR